MYSVFLSRSNPVSLYYPKKKLSFLTCFLKAIYGYLSIFFKKKGVDKFGWYIKSPYLCTRFREIKQRTMNG